MCLLFIIMSMSLMSHSVNVIVHRFKWFWLCVLELKRAWAFEWAIGNLCPIRFYPPVLCSWFRRILSCADVTKTKINQINYANFFRVELELNTLHRLSCLCRTFKSLRIERRGRNAIRGWDHGNRMHRNRPSSCHRRHHRRRRCCCRFFRNQILRSTQRVLAAITIQTLIERKAIKRCCSNHRHLMQHHLRSHSITTK